MLARSRMKAFILLSNGARPMHCSNYSREATCTCMECIRFAIRIGFDKKAILSVAKNPVKASPRELDIVNCIFETNKPAEIEILPVLERIECKEM